MTRAALVLLSMLACAPAQTASLQFDRFVASFVLRALGTTVGRSEWRLVPISDTRFLWETRSETAGAGALIRDVYVFERSESEIVGQTFRPLVYQYDRYGSNATRNVRVTFDWQDGMVVNTAQGHAWRMEVPPETLDKLSYLLALMRDLADGKRSMQYSIADGGRLKRYQLRAHGTETLQTALGPLETLKVVRLREDGGARATLWCAPALGYLPVKLERPDRDGELVSMTIESLQGLPPNMR